MPHLDSRAWIDSAKRYTRLRRRYWQFLFGFITLFAALGTPLFAFGDRLPPVVRSVLGFTLAAGGFACWAGSLVCWIALINFRCPRCGNPFVLGAGSTWPTNRCKHCRLDFRAAAMAPA